MLIDVLLPLPLRNTFTYALPEGECAEVGARVLVPFGAKRTYVGIVVHRHSDNRIIGHSDNPIIRTSEHQAYKEVLAVLDALPVVLPLQMKLWQWMGDYHQCSLGEVCKAALPAKMKTAKVPKLKKIRKPKESAALPTNPTSSLTAVQQQALESIQENFKEKNVVLLHGITSSGKTEIYIHLIEESIRQGKQVLYLLPEIALTTQITERLRKVFGNRLNVYHSKMTDTERAKVWEGLIRYSDNQIFRQSDVQTIGCSDNLNIEASEHLNIGVSEHLNIGVSEHLNIEASEHLKLGSLILGVRSSVLLPFSNLGLIIVDEEHEGSYKQYDPAPRYHARDTAIMLASLHGAKTLLGTATPSVESYRNVERGKYALVELTRRHQDIALPNIIVADVKQAKKRRQMKAHFTPLLLEKIEEALDRREQVILFQNRRGFAPLVECKQCAWVPRCRHCDVSLTYHKSNNRLSCHYCGAVYSLPPVCPLCGGELETKGFGTEKIEEDIKEIFPNINVARLDLDSTRRKNAYEETITGFERGEIDMLIGTQMITKGLDFERVSLVGILNADTMLNYPDFRAHERAFQLMAQVSGRAGRKGKQGTVILQTSNPEHPIIEQVIHNDYLSMYSNQIAEREAFRYPPFVRLVEITLKHTSAEKVSMAASSLAEELKQQLGASAVLGPDNPAVPRIQNLFLKHIVLKLPNNISLKKNKETLHNCIAQLQKSADFKSVIVAMDVDPM
jgi:primosomal protein N' (replication factor Y)